MSWPSDFHNFIMKVVVCLALCHCHCHLSSFLLAFESKKSGAHSRNGKSRSITLLYRFRLAVCWCTSFQRDLSLALAVEFFQYLDQFIAPFKNVHCMTIPVCTKCLINWISRSPHLPMPKVTTAAPCVNVDIATYFHPIENCMLKVSTIPHEYHIYRRHITVSAIHKIPHWIMENNCMGLSSFSIWHAKNPAHFPSHDPSLTISLLYDPKCF